MITVSEILMGRHHEYPPTPEMLDNLSTLLVRVNRLRQAYAKPMFVSSGYRPGHYNKQAGGAKGSAHLDCSAVDFRDRDGKLKKFLLDNTHLLEEFDLYMEDPARTPTWVHLDIKPRKTRIFKP